MAQDPIGLCFEWICLILTIIGIVTLVCLFISAIETNHNEMINGIKNFSIPNNTKNSSY